MEMNELTHLSKKANNKDHIDVHVYETKIKVKYNLEKEKLEIRQDRLNHFYWRRKLIEHIPKDDFNKVYSNFYLNQIIAGDEFFTVVQNKRFSKSNNWICHFTFGDEEYILKKYIKWKGI